MISMIAAGALTLGAVQLPQDQHCNMKLEHDLALTEQYTALYAEGAEMWRIDASGSVYLNDEAQRLSYEEQALALEYRDGLTRQAANVIEIMDDAIDIADVALTTAFTELFGERSRATRRVGAVTEMLRDELALVGSYDNQVYRLNGSALDTFDSRFSERLEEEMESIIMDSMGSMLMMVGRALIGGKGSFDERMEQFEMRMERMAETLEAEVDSRAAQIEQKAERMCDDMQVLAAVERNLAKSLFVFGEYALFQGAR